MLPLYVLWLSILIWLAATQFAVVYVCWILGDQCDRESRCSLVFHMNLICCIIIDYHIHYRKKNSKKEIWGNLMQITNQHDLSKRDKQRYALGRRLKSIRKKAGITLQEAGAKTGLAASSISKIENAQMSPTYDNLLRISAGYDVDIEELFGARTKNIAKTRYTVTRRGEGQNVRTDEYDYEMLCSTISHKKITPMIASINRKSIGADGLTKHLGEEMLFVLSGRVELHLEHYDTIVLEVGDCAYFDSTMGHALVSKGDDEAKIFWASTHLAQDRVVEFDDE